MSQILLHLSVAVRLLAFGWSVALVVRFRDRRLILLSAVLALMATRQALTDVLSLAGRASEAAVIAELPGLLVSIGMLLVVILIGRMIADYREAIRTASASAAALRENEARLQFVVDQAPVVLWALDQDGVFTLSEGRSLDVLGLEAGQVVGRSVFDVYEGHDEILDDARRALAGHHIRSVVQVGGTVFESRQRPITDASGVVRGVIGVATDVTARERAMRQLETSHRAVSEAYDHTLEGWVRALDLRDRETEGHTQRVTELTVELARSLGVPADEIEHIRRGALLHDIGKIGIPDSVLNKQGPLDDAEWELMRKHPVWAREMIAAVPFLEPALDIPYCHHERWDGTGYPQGLTGRSIPLAARAFAVVDVWDALLSERPYSPPWTEVEALAHLRAEAGGQFDPEVVTGFLGLLQERTREA
jgi:PAS domain S-box-containing protein/putative nucleotidyltransferase with HDIG domain